MNFYTNCIEDFSLIYSAFYSHLISDKLILVDGGAAGDISQPFTLAKDVIVGIRFEPRGASEIESSANDIYINGGLWSHDSLQTLHIAQIPFCSSICPPNDKYLEQFDDKYGYPPRKTIEKRSVTCRSIDSCVSKGEIPLPNFIKLDVHSAELPALQGASNSLEDCVGLLVEGWHTEVHQGQGLHYEVEQFACRHGFEVFDNTGLMRWRHKFEGHTHLADRPQYVGSEMLFIKKNVPERLLLKKAFVLALFKFGNAAKSVLAPLNSDDSRALIKAISEQQDRNLIAQERNKRM